MLQEKKRIWIKPGEKITDFIKYRDGKYELIFNIVSPQFNQSDVLQTISDIRKVQCGFDYHFPQINLFINIDDFSESVAEEIAAVDLYVPHIKTNIIISDKDVHIDPILSIAHKIYDISIKKKIFIAFNFVLLDDYRIIGLALRKINQLKAMICSHNDNMSSLVPIILEVSPLIFDNRNTSFYENTHFEIDNMIEELSSHEYFNMYIKDDICGLVNIVRQIALVRGITKKFYTLSTKDINFSFSNNSCFYNLFRDESLTCKTCKEKILKNLTLKLGIFDKAVEDFLEESGEKSEFKILTADWDYIV